MKYKLYLFNFTLKLFKFMSSIKLAIPLMVIIIGVVAFGTLIESRYNAEMAKILVYQTQWFSALMYLLWINIFFATLSRWPWNWNHLGFLITHLGLLTLLLGGYITAHYGIDGTLRILEGEEGDSVILPELELKITSNEKSFQKSFPINKENYRRVKRDFNDINKIPEMPIVIEEYIPFSSTNKSFKSELNNEKLKEPIAVLFNIKNSFFDLNETLYSASKKSLQMGPALFLLTDSNSKSDIKKPSLSKKMEVESIQNHKKSQFIIKDRNTSKELKTIALSEAIFGNSISVLGYKLNLIRSFKRARVGASGIIEDNEGELNPAIEIKIEKESVALRDVVFSKFSGFSLIQDKNFPLSFEYRSVENSAMSSLNDSSKSENLLVNGHSKNSNIVIFNYNINSPKQIKIDLKKNDTIIQSQFLSENESIETPWMGIKITLSSIYWNAKEIFEVLPVDPEIKSEQLPPSAIKFSYNVADRLEESFWLLEEEEKFFYNDKKAYRVSYGHRNIQLPFKLKLQKFNKIDYVGTNQAKSYESRVEIVHTMKKSLISMNIPLEEEGYLIYQSSYEELPDGRYASIFSVNKDPGRIYKYWGSLFLCLGIIVYTLMKSRSFRKWMIKYER